MKKTLLLIFTVFFTGFLSAQNLVDYNIDAGDDIQLDCLSGNCVDIDVDFPQTYNPTEDHAYNVISIPFDPVPATNPTGLTNDDTYSQLISLPFSFTMYGETYDQVIVGGNGDIVFNPAYAGMHNAWAIDMDELVPHPDLGANNNGPTAAIFGAFHDININDSNLGLNGTIDYEVTGNAPFRAFVVNYTNVAQFGSNCDNYVTTQQIVLHETSNYIDVYITDKPLCTSWNDGLAVIGIQNAGGTLGVTPPGRNTGQWEADMEAWRFMPVEDPNAANYLYNLLDEDGNVVSVNNPSNVCVDPADGNQTFTAQVIYTDGDGVNFNVEDDVEVIFNSEDLTGDLEASYEICGDVPQVPLDATPNDPSLDASELTYSWTNEDGDEVGSSANFTATEEGVYIVEVTYGNCSESFQTEVIMGDSPIVDLGADFESCFLSSVVLDATPSNFSESESTFVWSLNGQEIVGETGATLEAIEPGTYSVTVVADGCEIQEDVVINPTNFVVDLGGNIPVCENENQAVNISPLSIELNGVSVADDPSLDFTWTNDVGDVVGNSATLSNVTTGGEYTLLIDNGTCTGTASVQVVEFCIPEGISPGNNDGMNDCLDLAFLSDRTGIASIEFFNRYGTSVYERNNYVDEWCGQTNDGEDLPTGTYYYVIKFNGEDDVYGTVKTGWIYIAREVN